MRNAALICLSRRRCMTLQTDDLTLEVPLMVDAPSGSAGCTV